jgi:hypothetical protein
LTCIAGNILFREIKKSVPGYLMTLSGETAVPVGKSRLEKNRQVLRFYKVTSKNSSEFFSSSWF